MEGNQANLIFKKIEYPVKRMLSGFSKYDLKKDDQKENCARIFRD